MSQESTLTPGYRLLKSPWSDDFIEAISKTTQEIFIASPFVNTGGTRILSKTVRDPASVHLTLLTCLTTQSIVEGTTKPSALNELYLQFGQVRISSLGRLHAKVYIIDGKIGIITSANLTSGGLRTNFEYGMQIHDKSVIAAVREDMNHYYTLGNVLDREILGRIEELADEALQLKAQAERATRKTDLAARLSQTIVGIESELLQNRVKGGRTVNAIFSETILYALSMTGPLSTQQLHAFIQPLHPDICDDTVDRIINGQHFGRKWKHLVRDAQQHLKGKGLIDLRNGKWHLTGRGRTNVSPYSDIVPKSLRRRQGFHS